SRMPAVPVNHFGFDNQDPIANDLSLTNGIQVAQLGTAARQSGGALGGVISGAGSGSQMDGLPDDAYGLDSPGSRDINGPRRDPDDLRSAYRVGYDGIPFDLNPRTGEMEELEYNDAEGRWVFPSDAYYSSTAEERAKAKANIINSSSGQDGVVLSFRAPHLSEVPIVLNNGFRANDYPGDGVYLTVKALEAGKYADIYQGGILVVSTPVSVFSKLFDQGHILPDGLVLGAFTVLPSGIREFSNSSNISYIQPGSFELFDKFGAQ
ncbi:hypothetical protein N9J26_00585, partial [bacterium]|nr:hypothetical protein [bacterium]